MFLRNYLNICLIIFLSISFVHAQGTFRDTNPSATEKIFGDPNKKTTESSQAIYEDGGQSAQYRMTEAEKGLDLIKSEIANLKSEVAILKTQVQELQKNAQNTNSFNSINEYKPAKKIAPKPTPF